MIFNIYYINFPKVYEIKMMVSNIISLNKEITKDFTSDGQASMKSKLGINFMDWFKLGEAEVAGELKGSRSKKVFETFEIKTTKSVILSDIIEKSKEVKDFSSIEEGELLRIDNVKLSLENESELRIVKFINSGAFKDLVTPTTNGLDMNNLFNSMFKDYAYKIKGKFKENDNILIKIPLTFESEFESSYSVDDLFVGKVSVIGLYKGKIKVDDLKNSFQYFQELGQMQNAFPSGKEDEEEIEESHYKSKEDNYPYSFASSGDGNEYHYIDLLAIIQNVNIK